MTEPLEGQEVIPTAIGGGQAMPGPAIAEGPAADHAPAVEKMAPTPEPQAKRKKTLSDVLNDLVADQEKAALEHMEKADQCRNLRAALDAAPEVKAAFDAWGQGLMVGKLELSAD